MSQQLHSLIFLIHRSGAQLGPWTYVPSPSDRLSFAPMAKLDEGEERKTEGRLMLKRSLGDARGKKPEQFPFQSRWIEIDHGHAARGQLQLSAG